MARTTSDARAASKSDICLGVPAVSSLPKSSRPTKQNTPANAKIALWMFCRGAGLKYMVVDPFGWYVAAKAAGGVHRSSAAPPPDAKLQAKPSSEKWVVGK